jgi:hypothetical protein
VNRNKNSENIQVKNSLAKNKSKNTKRAVKPADVRSMVRSMLTKNVEMKYFDQFGGGGIPTAGTMSNISDIVRGSEVTQRIGNQVTLKRLQLGITTNIHPSAANSYTRAIIVLDKQGMNTPSISDVLETAYLSSPYVAVAPVHWDYRKRFKILADKKVLLTQAALTAACMEFDLSLNINAQYIGLSSTFVNQIYLILLSTEQNILALSGSYWQSRLTFQDE